MAEIESVLKNLTNRELNSASNYATRSTIKLRVLLKIAEMLGLSLQMIYETRLLYRIDVSCSHYIEKLWMEYYSNSRGGRNLFVVPSTVNLKTIHSASNVTNTSTTATINSKNNNPIPSNEDWATLERFLAKDFARNGELIRLIAVLKKRLPEKDLNYVFAVDGLHPTEDSSILESSSSNNNNECISPCWNQDYKPYFENLSVPMYSLNMKKIECFIQERKKEEKFNRKDDYEEPKEPIRWIHVRAIRAIYENLDNIKPEVIGKVLKNIFEGTEKKEKIQEDSSSDSENEMNEKFEMNDSYDVIGSNIENLYRRIVGDQLANIVLWKEIEIKRLLTKENSRKRKNDFDGERRNKPGRPPRKNKTSYDVNTYDIKRTDEDVEEMLTEGEEEKGGENVEVAIKKNNHKNNKNEGYVSKKKDVLVAESMKKKKKVDR